MTDLFLERTFATPRTVDEALAEARAEGWCLEQYRVRWHASYLARDGRSQLCWMSAPDAESARAALRQTGTDTRGLHKGTVHGTAAGDPVLVPNVIVIRELEEAVSFAVMEERAKASMPCLSNHRVQFVRSFLADHGQRMWCFYRAPDAEAVRIAQRQAGMPVYSTWAFERIDPTRLAGASPGQESP